LAMVIDAERDDVGSRRERHGGRWKFEYRAAERVR
jgi:hypothetical protein